MRDRYERRSRHFAGLMQQHLATQPADQRLHLEGAGTESLAAWFLGPRGENGPLFAELISDAVKVNVEDRNGLFQDPPYITEARKDEAYHQGVAMMKAEYQKLLRQLKGSVPFFSYRYQAHMNWDLTLPAMLGYVGGMLYNQNNVALEASPVTSRLEKLVGDDLCKMLGFNVSDTQGTRSWGHITCDGSVANLEALWAARNLKYYPLSVKAALQNEPKLKGAKNIEVTLGNGRSVKLIQQDAWTLLNLSVDGILSLSDQIQADCGIDSTTLSNLLNPYLLQTQGIETFMANYASGIARPVLMGPATKHYSWPKNAALTGLGESSFLNIVVDEDARLECKDLEKTLAQCLKYKQPVMMVMAVLGSTEESAVDPLARIIEIRDKFRPQGLDFAIHVDGAWGGYFASMIREPQPGAMKGAPAAGLQVTPVLELSPYVTEQYQALPGADSVTIDPHKAGYVPYAAGGLCYRNGAMRYLVAFKAPEVYHGSDVDQDMGIFGVEGSKPGAAVAGVYLSHRVIRPDQSGYGKILGQALFNSKRFYCAIVTMATETDDFIVVPVQQIPAEKEGGSAAQIKAQLAAIKTSIVERQNNEIVADPKAMALLKQLGSDMIIITYGLNFKRKGKLNPDPAQANSFMHDVFTKLSLQADAAKMPDLIITTSEFGPEEYGAQFVRTYMKRLGLGETYGQAGIPTMNFLSSTTMCPWLTATAEGDFIPTLVTAFRSAISEVLSTGSYR